jgi:hypothetical protein
MIPTENKNTTHLKQRLLPNCLSHDLEIVTLNGRYVFTNSGKFKEDVLNRIEQGMKVTITLNSLLCRKYFSVNTKKRKFCTVVERVLSCGWVILTLDYKLKKNC